MSRGFCLGGLCQGGVSVRETPQETPPCTVMSGRYASYWNAFLLQLASSPVYLCYMLYGTLYQLINKNVVTTELDTPQYLLLGSTVITGNSDLLHSLESRYVFSDVTNN